MSIVSSWMIVASVLTAPTAVSAAAVAVPTDAARLPERYPAAVELYHCDFDPEEVDRDQDGWPKGWQRRTGAGFPHYVDIALVDAPSPGNDHCLRIDMDGGAATAYGPRIDVSSLSSYVMEAWLKTEDLINDHALLSVTLLDEHGESLERFDSQVVGGTRDWVKLRIGPFAPESAAARYAVVGLDVRPGKEAGLTGTVLCDDVWLGYLPRVTLDTSKSQRWVAPTDDVEVVCHVSGVLSPDAVCTFAVEDALGQVLQTHERRLDDDDGFGGDTFGDTPAATGASSVASMQRTFRLRPKIHRTGFYRILARLSGGDGLRVERSLNLAVVDDTASISNGEFGWSLPGGEQPLSQSELLKLVSQVGVSRVKFPVWIDGEDTERLERLVWFTERMNSRGVEVIGMLHQPPESALGVVAATSGPAAADIFTADADSWYPSLEPVVARLAMRVRLWQLGSDDDESFQGAVALEPMLESVKRRLDEVGQGVQLGMGWNWMEQPPVLTDAAAYVVNLSANPPLTPDELADQLDQPAGSSLGRWVDVSPLARDDYTTTVRARDLVLRMVAAKIHGAGGIFLANPFDPERGVMSPDGNPGELIFAWRTTAKLLAGAEYLGQLRLPGGSHNHVFARGGEVVMVAWSDEKNAQEVLYLGDSPEWVDIWGGHGPLCDVDDRHVVELSDVPLFITGLDERVTRLRLAIELAPAALEPRYGRPQASQLTLHNPLDEGISAYVRLNLPPRWKCTPSEIELALSGHSQENIPLQITLPVGGQAGPHMVRADVALHTDRDYRFSVYRDISVADDRVTIDAVTRTTDSGDLLVEQFITNHSDETVSFRCYLRGPDMHHQSRQVKNLGPGTDVAQYQIEGGADRVGQSLLLEVREVLGDRRTLNHWFTVEP